MSPSNLFLLGKEGKGFNCNTSCLRLRNDHDKMFIQTMKEKKKKQVFLCRRKYFTTGKCQAQNVSESGEPDVTNAQYCVQDSAPGKCGLTTLSVSFVVLTVTVGSAGNVPSYDKEPADTARALFQPRDRMSSNALSQ